MKKSNNSFQNVFDQIRAQMEAMENLRLRTAQAGKDTASLEAGLRAFQAILEKAA